MFFVFSIFASGSSTSRVRAGVIPRCSASGIACFEAKILFRKSDCGLDSVSVKGVPGLSAPVFLKVQAENPADFVDCNGVKLDTVPGLDNQFALRPVQM